VKTFGVCDFSRLAVTDWRLRRWRLWFLALLIATPILKGRKKDFCETLRNYGSFDNNELPHLKLHYSERSFARVFIYSQAF